MSTIRDAPIFLIFGYVTVVEGEIRFFSIFGSFQILFLSLVFI